MKKRLSFYILIIFAIHLLSAISSISALADELPPSWPWRGVTMNQNATHPEDMLMLTKSLNVNSVRLTLRPRSLSKTRNLAPDKAWQATLDWADAMLDACKQNNLTCILSMSQFPIDPALGLKQSSSKFWKSPKLMDQVVRLSTELANRFHDRGPELGAYQILNEPLVREGKPQRPQNWPLLIQRIIDGIRKHDPNRYICVAAGPGGTPRGIRTFHPIPRKRLIYTAHMYIPHSFTHQGVHGRKRGQSYPSQLDRDNLDKKAIYQAFKHLQSFEKANNALIYISEFSAVRWAHGAEQYLLDVVEIMASFSWSYSYHSWGGYHAWSPFYDDTFSENKPKTKMSPFLKKKTPRFHTLYKIFNPTKTSNPPEATKP